MSRINDLIAEHCPDGVACKTLGEIGELVRGNGLPKTDFTETGVGAIHYGQIYTYYGTSATQTISFVAPATAARLAKVDPGDIIITNTSENLDDVGKSVAWLGDDQIVTGGHATVLKHDEDPRFVAYWLQSPSFQLQKKRLATGTKVMDVSAKQLATVRIPVPPRPVQREIVATLDRMEALEAELKAALGAELDARRRQYAFLVSQILAGIDAEPEALRDLGVWRGGVTPSKAEPRYWELGTIPWLASMDVSESEAREIRGRVTPAALAETSLRVFPPESVVVVMRSNILRNRLPIGFTRVETTVNQDLKALLPRDDVDPGYVFQVLRAMSDQIRIACVRTDGSMAAVDSKAFLDWSIPVPSVQDQRHIATQLRAFEAAAGELEIALAGERAARRTQYEHFRDRLLRFEECAA